MISPLATFTPTSAADAIIALRFRTRTVKSIQERTAAMAWTPATAPSPA